MLSWCDKVKNVINAELKQVCCLAKLAMLAPDEAARNMVLSLIGGALDEAMFWSHVHCAVCGSCKKGSHEVESQSDTAASDPGPDIAFTPVLGSPCPSYPGVTCPGFCPGKPYPPACGKPCPGIGPSVGTSPGGNIGSDTSGGPGMLPGPGMWPGPGMGMGAGFDVPPAGAAGGGGAGKGPSGIFGPGTSFGPNHPAFGGGIPIFIPGMVSGIPEAEAEAEAEAEPPAAEKDKE